MSKIRKKTEWWCAWIAPNGRSWFDEPRRLYYADWESRDYWDKDGNAACKIDSVGGFSDIHSSGGFMTELNHTADPDKGLFSIPGSGDGIASVASFWGMVQIAFAADGNVSNVDIIADSPTTARDRAWLHNPIAPK